MNQLPYLILSPVPFIVVCSERDLHFYVWNKDVEGKHGKYHAQRNKVPCFNSLYFFDGQQDEAVKPNGNMLEISGRASTQLLLFHGAVTHASSITGRDLKLFFEGNALNQVERYIEHVMQHMVLGTPLHAMQGSMSRYSVGRERNRNGAFWRNAVAPL